MYDFVVDVVRPFYLSCELHSSVPAKTIHKPDSSVLFVCQFFFLPPFPHDTPLILFSCVMRCRFNYMSRVKRMCIYLVYVFPIALFINAQNTTTSTDYFTDRKVIVVPV